MNVCKKTTLLRSLSNAVYLDLELSGDGADVFFAEKDYQGGCSNYSFSQVSTHFGPDRGWYINQGVYQYAERSILVAQVKLTTNIISPMLIDLQVRPDVGLYQKPIDTETYGGKSSFDVID